MHSLDCKFIKFKFGDPIHINTKDEYAIAGVIPLNEFRKLAFANYIIRSKAVRKFNVEEFEIRSDIHVYTCSKNVPKSKVFANTVNICILSFFMNVTLFRYSF